MPRTLSQSCGREGFLNSENKILLLRAHILSKTIIQIQSMAIQNSTYL